MKKFAVLLTTLVLAYSNVWATPSDSDCGDDDVKPIMLTANQN